MVIVVLSVVVVVVMVEVAEVEVVVVVGLVVAEVEVAEVIVVLASQTICHMKGMVLIELVERIIINPPVFFLKQLKLYVLA